MSDDSSRAVHRQFDLRQIMRAVAALDLEIVVRLRWDRSNAVLEAGLAGLRHSGPDEDAERDLDDGAERVREVGNARPASCPVARNVR